MTYSLNPDCGGEGFSVPDEIVDKHFLRLASGEQLKVLLLILRKAPEKLDIAKIAKALKYNESDVEDYIQYWMLTGILRQNDADVTAASPVKYVPSEKAKAAAAMTAVVPKPQLPEYTRPSQSEVAARMDESPDIRNLFRELQKKMGKTIGYDGQCTFICLYDRFGLSADVIFMLVDYCLSIGKSGYSYIEAVGGGWAEQEIDTIEKAAKKIASLNTVGKFWKKFAAAAGLDTPKPTSKQSAYIEKWIGEWGMSLELVSAAYEQMAEHTGKLSFAYMDKILASWCEQGFVTPDDVAKAEKSRKDAAAKPALKSNTNASYDLDKYTNQALNRPLKYERKGKK